MADIIDKHEKVFDDFRLACVDDARRLFAKDGCICPVFFLVKLPENGSEGESGVYQIPVEFENEHEKNIVAMAIRFLIEKTGASIVVFIHEGWMLDSPEDVDDPRVSGIQIADHPRRKEALCIVAESRWSRWFYCAKIRRDGEGEDTPGELLDGSWVKQNHAEANRFCGFFVKQQGSN